MLKSVCREKYKKVFYIQIDRQRRKKWHDVSICCVW
jgi:hypothetical protein